MPRICPNGCLTNAQIVNGDLILSFSQGDPINLGKVVGSNGDNGASLEDVTLDGDGNLSVTYGGATVDIGNIKGQKGDDGAAGKSAYEIYKEKNPSYTGDEDQWMSDLVNGKLATEQVVKYTVTFNSDGGTPVASQQVEENKKAIQPDNPTREGYTFIGWYGGKYGDEKWVFIGYVVSEDITLTAKWIENIYTITFDSNGGDAVASIQAKYKQSLTLPTATKDGFAFAGWLLDGQLIEQLVVVTGDVSLIAKWVNPTYQVTFDVNGGDNAINPIIYNYGQAYTLPQPTKIGSEFAPRHGYDALL